jgi:Ran GTPase-activating protein (RanGAP) involved in mRNA processing and transport
LSSARLDAAAGYSLAALIEAHPRLESLNVGFNRLQSNGGSMVLGALQRNRRLAFLDISGNQLTSAGLDELESALGNRSDGLTSLNLGQNNLGDAGAGLVARALKNNSCLRHALLNQYNQISDAGAIQLASVLLKSDSTRLQTLDLSGNEISLVGAESVLTSLRWRAAQGLTCPRVSLHGNNAPAGLVNEIAAAASSTQPSLSMQEKLTDAKSSSKREQSQIEL